MDTLTIEDLLPEMESFAPSTIGITDVSFKVDSIIFFIDDKCFSLEILLIFVSRNVGDRCTPGSFFTMWDTHPRSHLNPKVLSGQL